MSVTVAELVAKVTTSGVASAQSQLVGLGKAVDGANGSMKALVAGGIIVAGTALLGLGVKSTQMAANFQSGLTSLVTGANESTSNLKMVGAGLLKMAVDTGTSTKQLTDGLYMIESGGFHGAAGLKILQAAAEGAKVQNADLGVVADATDTIIKNFGSTGLTAANAVNTLVATVKNGKTHMQDLSASLSGVLPTASAAKVGLNDVMGAMATMTGMGVPAAQAATFLRQTILSLEVPSSKGAKALKDVGLSAADVSNEMHKSLPGALQMITDHLKAVYGEGTPAYVSAVKDISGGSKTMQGMLDLTGTHLQVFKDDVASIADAVKKGGNSIVGWTAVQGTFNQKMDQAKAAVEVLMISLGTKFLPVLTQVASAFVPIIQGISNMAAQSTSATGFFTQIADGWKEAFAGIDGSAISKAIKGMVQDFQQFGATVGPLILPFFNNLNNMLANVAVAFSGVLAPAINYGRQLFVGWAGVLKTVMVAVEMQLFPAIQKLAEAIGPVVTAIVKWIVQSNILPTTFAVLKVAIGTVITVIATLINGLANVITFFNKNHDAAALLLIPLGILGGYFTTLAVTAIASFIATIPAMVGGFLAGAAAAGTMALAVIAATWPFLVAGLVIGAIVAGIILAVRHWGEIVAWLKQAWSGVSGFFSGIWNDIKGFFGNVGNWFHDRFTDAKNGVQSAFGNVGNWFHDRFSEAKNGVQTGWGNVSGFFSNAAKTVMTPFLPLATFTASVFQTINNIIAALVGKAVDWLKGKWNEVVMTVKMYWMMVQVYIEYYLALIQAKIWQIIGPIVQWLKDRWTMIKTDVTVVWDWITAHLTQIWLNIENAIRTKILDIWNFLALKWTDIKKDVTVVWDWITSHLNQIWTNIKTDVSNVWNWITTFISNMWNKISTTINDKVTTIKNGILGPFNQARDAIGNVIKQFANNMIGMLNNGLKSVEDFINFFGQGLDKVAIALGAKATIPVAHLGPIPTYATGTPSGGHPGGPAIVGEQGPELVMLPKGASVLPNGPTKQLLGELGIPGYASGIGNVLGDITSWIAGGAKSILDNMLNKLHINLSLPGDLASIASGALDTVKNWAIGFIQNILPKASSGKGGTGGVSAGPGQAVNVPGNLLQWISQAIGLTSAPSNWANDLAIIAMHESGGNPSVQNNWDINAQNGDPSRGLFQTIGSTFAAYMVPGHGNILNPIDNAAAAIKYIMARYGSVFNVPGIVSLAAGGPYVGYANGVTNAPGGWAMVGERGPEAMYVPRGAQIVPNHQLGSMQSGAPQIVVNPPPIYLDGRMLAQGLMPYIVDQIRYTQSTGTHW